MTLKKTAIRADRRFCGNKHIDRPPKLIAAAEEICMLYPEMFSVGSYPLVTTKCTVHFKISEKTMARRKPYNMTRKKEGVIQQEIQNILDANIIWFSVPLFVSSFTIALKADKNFRLCTAYRALNKQNGLAFFLMPRMEAIIDKIWGCRCFSLTAARDFGMIFYNTVTSCTQSSQLLSTCMSTTASPLTKKILRGLRWWTRTSIRT